ncbi:MAG: hypothetical protein AAFQ76_11895 [Cyanobacteria bacterium J06626_26]
MSAAELQLLISSFLSPFYAWQQGLMGTGPAGDASLAPRSSTDLDNHNELATELEKKTVLPPHAHGSNLS